MKSAGMNAARGHPTAWFNYLPNSPEMGCLNYSTPQSTELGRSDSNWKSEDSFICCLPRQWLQERYNLTRTLILLFKDTA